MTDAANLGFTLEDVHEQMATCRLCLDTGNYVFPRAIHTGDASARIMTIGQAPGITEKDVGRPFNAGSGKRLFQWLGEADIEETWFRSTQYMTSVTKCYPGRAKSGSGDRVPSKVEQRLCSPYLQAEIMLVDPYLIIPIGRLAIELFYSKKLKLDEIIGTHKEVDGHWIVPFPHSSGASRWHQTAENRERIQQAIGLVREHVRELYPDGVHGQLNL